MPELWSLFRNEVSELSMIIITILRHVGFAFSYNNLTMGRLFPMSPLFQLLSHVILHKTLQVVPRSDVVLQVSLRYLQEETIQDACQIWELDTGHSYLRTYKELWMKSIKLVKLMKVLLNARYHNILPYYQYHHSMLPFHDYHNTVQTYQHTPYTILHHTT